MAEPERMNAIQEAIARCEALEVAIASKKKLVRYRAVPNISRALARSQTNDAQAFEYEVQQRKNREAITALRPTATTSSSSTSTTQATKRATPTSPLAPKPSTTSSSSSAPSSTKEPKVWMCAGSFFIRMPQSAAIATIEADQQLLRDQVSTLRREIQQASAQLEADIKKTNDTFARAS